MWRQERKCLVLRTLTHQSVLIMISTHALSSWLGRARRSLGDRNRTTPIRTIPKYLSFCSDNISTSLSHAQMRSLYEIIWSRLQVFSEDDVSLTSPAAQTLQSLLLLLLQSLFEAEQVDAFNSLAKWSPFEIKIFRDYNFSDNLTEKSTKGYHYPVIHFCFRVE